MITVSISVTCVSLLSEIIFAKVAKSAIKAIMQVTITAIFMVFAFLIALHISSESSELMYESANSRGEPN